MLNILRSLTLITLEKRLGSWVERRCHNVNGNQTLLPTNTREQKCRVYQRTNGLITILAKHNP